MKIESFELYSLPLNGSLQIPKALARANLEKKSTDSRTRSLVSYISDRGCIEKEIVNSKPLQHSYKITPNQQKNLKLKKQSKMSFLVLFLLALNFSLINSQYAKGVDCDSTCSSCTSDKKCASCPTGRKLADGGFYCVDIVSCKDSIKECDECACPTVCLICKTGFVTSVDGKCIKTCTGTISNCVTCLDSSRCAVCSTGLKPTDDKTKCVETMVTSQLKMSSSSFSPDIGSAVVEFQQPVSELNLDEFTYKIIDYLTFKQLECDASSCKASHIPSNPKALTFSFNTNFTVRAGKCVVSYPKVMRKTSKRILQGDDSKYSFSIEGISLSARADNCQVDQPRNGHIGLNAVRFFSTIWLSIFTSPHAFWATRIWSWIQVLAFLKGP